MPTNNMVISPMQQDYVTKEEFGEFKEEFRDFRKDVDNRFNSQREYMDGAFYSLDNKIDFVDKNLGDKIDTLDSKVTRIDLNLHSLAGDVSWIKKSMGKLMKKVGVS